MKICSFGECGRPVFARGLCQAHYLQQKAGQPLKPIQRQFHGLTEEQRFRAMTDIKSVKECWEWKASKRPDGYGQWRRSDGRIELAHRAAWRLFRGAIPEGAFILHRCDNPGCVNAVGHMFLGSQTDNMRDMWGKGRARPGVSKGENHGMSKLTAELVREIRASNERGSVIARRLGFAHTTICDIRKRKTWKHID